MFTSILLFVLYTLLFAGFLGWMSRKGIIQLSPPLAISGFLMRIFLGCLYGYIYGIVYNGDDTWRYHWLSVEETRNLVKDPISFLSTLLTLEEYTVAYEMKTAWESVEFGFLIKLLAFFNLFSGGEYYVNVVLFSMISFWSSYFLYRLFQESFQLKRTVFRGSLFFYIPVIFWTSGIRKDGLIFLGFSIFLYAFYRLYTTQYRRYLPGLLTGLLLLLLNRHMLAFTLLPAAVLFVLIRQTRIKLIYLLPGYLLFLIISLFLLPEEFPLLIHKLRISFEALTGGSRMEMPEMDGTRYGLLKSIPHALYNVLLQPLPTGSAGLLSILSGLDTGLVLLAILLAVVFPGVKSINRSQIALLASLFLLCLMNYVIIGMIVPFSGATVRYRAPFEAMLITAVLSLTDFSQWRKKIVL